MGSSIRVIQSPADAVGADTSAYWIDAIWSALLPAWIRAPASAPLQGRLEHVACDGIGLTVVECTPQQVSRTRKLIARDGRDDVLVDIQVTGHGWVHQDGRHAFLSPGVMTFTDSTRSYALEFDDEFSQLVIRVPRARLSHRSLQAVTAVALDAAGPGRLVAEFWRGLERKHRTDPQGVEALIPHAVGLLDWAVGWARGAVPSTSAAADMTYERIHRFVRRHACDPSTDADMAAAACGISRRSLFRALALHGESFTSLVRAQRVERARQLLLSAPGRSVASLATECGFGGETQLHRAFREVTGLTPAAYRSAQKVSGGAIRQ
ncbi:AraC family transcriptional regulator [Streptomyces sp. NPDC089424]|uniref:AraC family transcriptional regulator n=1 Tax=Streptomyces sp. NPDC089424 TaxID=3365917 RepID=UPI0037FDBCBE